MDSSLGFKGGIKESIYQESPNGAVDGYFRSWRVGIDGGFIVCPAVRRRWVGGMAQDRFLQSDAPILWHRLCSGGRRRLFLGKRSSLRSVRDIERLAGRLRWSIALVWHIRGGFRTLLWRIQYRH